MVGRKTSMLSMIMKVTGFHVQTLSTPFALRTHWLNQIRTFLGSTETAVRTRSVRSRLVGPRHLIWAWEWKKWGSLGSTFLPKKFRCRRYPYSLGWTARADGRADGGALTAARREPSSAKFGANIRNLQQDLGWTGDLVGQPDANGDPTSRRRQIRVGFGLQGRFLEDDGNSVSRHVEKDRCKCSRGCLIVRVVE